MQGTDDFDLRLVSAQNSVIVLVIVSARGLLLLGLASIVIGATIFIDVFATVVILARLALELLDRLFGMLFGLVGSVLRRLGPYTCAWRRYLRGLRAF